MIGFGTGTGTGSKPQQGWHRLAEQAGRLSLLIHPGPGRRAVGQGDEYLNDSEGSGRSQGRKGRKGPVGKARPDLRISRTQPHPWAGSPGRAQGRPGRVSGPSPASSTRPRASALPRLALRAPDRRRRQRPTAASARSPPAPDRRQRPTAALYCPQLAACGLLSAVEGGRAGDENARSPTDIIYYSLDLQYW